MKRILADIPAFSVLVGLLQIISFLHLLDFDWGLYFPLAALFFAGFVRGILEPRFLKTIRTWIAAIEWAVVVLTVDLVLCIPSSKTDADTNYWTIFGAFFMILIVPSIPLNVGGFLAAIALQTEPKAGPAG